MVMHDSVLQFVNEMDKNAQELIENFERTSDLGSFKLLENNSAHGTVYRFLDYPYVLKIYKAAGMEHQDHFILNQIQSCPYSPKLYAYKDNGFVVMEFIEGVNIQEYINLKQSLPEGFYAALKEALYEITYRSHHILNDMKVDSSVIINPNTGTFKIIDYGVVDRVYDWPIEASLEAAHKQFFNFLLQINDYQLFNEYPEEEELLNKVLIVEAKKGTIDYFLETECIDLYNILKNR
jgi:serine/threonine protein kinase